MGFDRSAAAGRAQQRRKVQPVRIAALDDCQDGARDRADWSRLDVTFFREQVADVEQRIGSVANSLFEHRLHRAVRSRHPHG